MDDIYNQLAEMIVGDDNHVWRDEAIARIQQFFEKHCSLVNFSTQSSSMIVHSEDAYFGSVPSYVHGIQNVEIDMTLVIPLNELSSGVKSDPNVVHISDTPSGPKHIINTPTKHAALAHAAPQAYKPYIKDIKPPKEEEIDVSRFQGFLEDITTDKV